MFTVSKCSLKSEMLISNDSAPIRGRRTLKDAEQFRTGSIIHEYNHAFWYTKSCLKSSIKFQERCIKSCQKSQVKSDTIYNRDNTNNTQTNLENREENVPSCTVNKHMVNMSPGSSNKEGNEMSNKQRETISENDLKNRSVSSDQCLSGTSEFNNCIREYSKFNRNKKVFLRSSFSVHVMHYFTLRYKGMLLTVLPILATYVTATVNPVEYR